MALEESLGGGLFALALGLIILIFLVAIAFYVYMSLAFMAIAKKAKQSSPGIAWIPGIGPTLIAFRAAKMHWWPWLLVIGFFIPIVNIFAGILFGVFTVIWEWKMFEVIKRPGWWAILMLIPIVNFVIMGIAAWGEK